jgi:hypothetical protein
VRFAAILDLSLYLLGAEKDTTERLLRGTLDDDIANETEGVDDLLRLKFFGLVGVEICSRDEANRSLSPPS